MSVPSPRESSPETTEVSEVSEVSEALAASGTSAVSGASPPAGVSDVPVAPEAPVVFQRSETSDASGETAAVPPGSVERDAAALRLGPARDVDRLPQDLADDATARRVPLPPNEASIWNIANGLTLLRILMVPVFAWYLLADDGRDTRSRTIAAVIFAAAMITDRIDGDVARRRNLVTNVGKIADPIADKALTGMAFIGLSVVGDLAWWVTLVVLVREWGVTAIRLVIIRHGVLPAGRGGKLKTLLQAGALFLFVLPLRAFPGEQIWHGVAWAVMVVALAVTLISGVDYVIKAFRLRQGSARTANKRTDSRARAEAQGFEDRDLETDPARWRRDP